MYIIISFNSACSVYLPLNGFSYAPLFIYQLCFVSQLPKQHGTNSFGCSYFSIKKLLYDEQPDGVMQILL